MDPLEHHRTFSYVLMIHKSWVMLLSKSNSATSGARTRRQTRTRTSIRRRRPSRRSRSTSKVRFVTFSKSPKRDKKLRATFANTDGKIVARVDFGAAGASDYTKHKDTKRKRRYMTRHQAREHWNDPVTPGALSRWVLWNKPSLAASMDDYRSRFHLRPGKRR
jgi:hypothetical protein